ncbi:polyhydroxybutyrate depolymerase [Leisingera sp. ANG-M1]|uniref:alpha/beta hydrolase family esterase n=1 Tax=Leisingera sp. ANG-M1 TaxID=1577895 RepID=UPI0005805F50|nr:polyhydroxybutyrate depolymerase [Leisingera sp. ANG-M1]KIC11989.1 polyhydroxybutyrate depolymerase [Leisingera sp. ANG-M1]
MIRAALSFAAALLWASSASAMGPWQASDCHGETACALEDRSYHVMAPDGWDGVTPLPVLLHFHGWARTGVNAQRSDRVGASTRRRGVLLVTPNGRRKTWDFWSSGTEDVGFANRVLEDVAKRYPVDMQNIFVSGYSYGSAMAWRYVCESGNHVAALLGIAGAFPPGETCPEAPRQVRHVHGVSDTVMPFPNDAYGADTVPMGLWRARLDCGAGQGAGDWQVVDFLKLSRVEWRDCAGGQVVLDTHPGGHFIPHGWIGRQLDELLGLAPSYP